MGRGAKRRHREALQAAARKRFFASLAESTLRLASVYESEGRTEMAAEMRQLAAERAKEAA
jgi:hypothetical protein